MSEGLRVSDAASSATVSDGATSAKCVICLSAASVASRREQNFGGQNFPRELAGCVVVLGAHQTGRMNGGLARPTGACGGASGAVSRILRSRKRSFPGAQILLRLTLFYPLWYPRKIKVVIDDALTMRAVR